MDMIALPGSPVVAMLLALAADLLLLFAHMGAWKTPLEELQGVFPVLLSAQEMSTETRCKTFQPGVESNLETFNQSLSSAGIQGCASNVGVIAVLPWVATTSPCRDRRKMVQMLSHAVGGTEVHHCCLSSIKPGILFNGGLSHILANGHLGTWDI